MAIGAPCHGGAASPRRAAAPSPAASSRLSVILLMYTYHHVIGSSYSMMIWPSRCALSKGSDGEARNSQMTAHGPSRHCAATQQFSRFRGEADIQRAALTEP